MAHPRIIPKILEALEPYLEEKDREWEAQPRDNRVPTLPQTVDGKVNVTGLVQELTKKYPELKLTEDHKQHFHRKNRERGPNELAALVNVLAKAQGLKPIGSRASEGSIESAAEERIDKLGKRSSDLARNLGEREAIIEMQRRKIESLTAQLEMLESTGMVLRTAQVK